MAQAKAALVVGAGQGISGAVATGLRDAGYRVAVAARDLDRLAAWAQPEGLVPLRTDVADAASVKRLFADADSAVGEPEVVLFNPSARVRGDLLSLDVDEVARVVQVTALGAFATAQEAARRMLPKGRGAIFFTGATAGVKGFARSSPFAMAKFALRGLAQSLARELAPQGVHVAHFVIDGGVQPPGSGDDRFSPEAIAQTYLAVLRQPKGAWSWEVELRANTEPF